MRENLNTCSFLPEGVYYNVLTARLVNSDPLVRTGIGSCSGSPGQRSPGRYQEFDITARVFDKYRSRDIFTIGYERSTVRTCPERRPTTVPIP